MMREKKRVDLLKESVIVPEKSRRVQGLFIMVILLFAILIGRLYYMQVIDKDFYDKKLQTASKKEITIPTVRGLIYDAKGRPLVENKSKLAAAYTRTNKTTAQEIKTTAQKLATYIDLSDPRVSDHDKVDYYLADMAVYRELVATLPKDKRFDNIGNPLPEATMYKNVVAVVPRDKLDYPESETKAIALFTQMNAASNFQTKNLTTSPLTVEQVSAIVNHTDDLPGITVEESWDQKVLDTSVGSFLGTISSEKTGLPQEELKDYLAKGYARNDRVGTSYLEKQYEADLQGKRKVNEVVLDKNGNLDTVKTIQEGQAGHNLQLTIDLDFQSGVLDIVRSYYQAEVDKGTAAYSPGAYAVVLDVTNGNVLAATGFKHDSNSATITENSLGTINDVFTPGSIVKPATLTAGWGKSVISGNQTLQDQSIQFKETNPLNSWFTSYGARPITAVQAIEYSSNTYMAQVALKLLGVDYTPNMYAPGKGDTLKTGMETLRGTYAQYGLGTSTGLDVPVESQGFLPREYGGWDYITESFGQFDNYTPMQMAQYVATIANGGKRIAPHLVSSVYETKGDNPLGTKIRSIDGKELNTVSISSENMALIHQGMYDVTHGTSGLTTGKGIGASSPVSVSAKTGTAETYVTAATGEVLSAYNTNVIAYAPSDNPRIAVAVVLPDVLDSSSKASKAITTAIINLYYNQHPNS